MKTFVVGVTGSIGSGKSFVLRCLGLLKIPTINADVISRNIFESELGISIIKANFPQVIKAGVIDRARLREIVFKDEQARENLNDIVHPLVYEAIDEKISQLKSQGERLVAVEIPLLYETGGGDICDKVIVCAAPYQLRKERVLKHRGLSQEDFQQIDKVQMSQDEKIKLADIVINTDKPKHEVFRQVYQYIICNFV